MMRAYAANPISRREVLQATGCGFGYLAFKGMCAEAAASESNPLAPKRAHFTPRAERIIFLCMRGGPSHLDTFDYKPQLNKADGQTSPGRRGAKLLGSPWKFSQHGESGHWISELFPNVARVADQLCMVQSMNTDFPAHPQAFVQLHTGNAQFVRPSLGAWTLYGLGTENSDLPGYITLSPPNGIGGAQNYGSAFLPAIYSATKIGQERLPISRAKINNIDNSRFTERQQRVQLDLVQQMNRLKLQRDQFNPGVEGVIESYELAFRMQSKMPELFDWSDETQETLDLYGLDRAETANFGQHCLLARRFAEAGVRYIELTHGNWDQHRNLQTDLERNCRQTDQPIAALLTDLKRRGLLDDTLVIWGGEFGRTPFAQNGDGRDHNNKGFTMWMAGGGIQGGLAYGRTDEIGYEAIESKVHIHDLHATMLHLMGLDHERLTYRYAGRDMRLTDVYGKVIDDIFA